MQKSKAVCTLKGSKTLKPKNVKVATTCGSVITVDLTIAKKNTKINAAKVTSVGKQEELNYELSFKVLCL